MRTTVVQLIVKWLVIGQTMPEKPVPFLHDSSNSIKIYEVKFHPRVCMVHLIQTIGGFNVSKQEI